MNDSNKLYDQTKRNQESKAFYKSAAWRKAREMALKRDNYLCQSCLSNKKIQRAEVVHHIQELVDYPELATTLDNLISWCNSCHTVHHKSLTVDDNTSKSNVEIILSKQNEEISI